MGVSLDIYRCRIGSFQCRSNVRLLAPKGKAALKVSFAGYLPLLVCAMLLLIAGIEPNPGPEDTHACKFCHLQFRSAQQYCDHLKVHQSIKKLVIQCTFPNCGSQLTSIASFRAHLFRNHHQVKSQESGASSECVRCPVCPKRVSSRKEFMIHMVVNHLSKGESFECVFEGCSTMMKFVTQFRTHMSRNHKGSSVPSDVPEQSPNLLLECNDNLEDELDEISSGEGTSDEDQDLYPDFIVKQEVARFYLKLEAEHLLPTSTVQSICDEITILTELIHHRLKRALRMELQQTDISAAMIDLVIDRTFHQDTVFNVHHKHEDVEYMGTNHMRMQYWTKTFPFVEPKRIVLKNISGKKRYSHHVPIKETLSVLLKDERVKKMVIDSFTPTESDPNILQDFTDGTAYKDHISKHHEGNHKCLQLLVFQDGFEFNAFGPSTGLFKPNPFYYTLGNIPAKYRYNLDLIQLCYMILDKDLKPSQEEELKDIDKLKEAMEPVLEELADLKKNGIEFNGEKIPVCLMFLVGDSLGQHVFGGFVKNFSGAEFWCRFCPISKSDFLAIPDETKPYRTVEDYNECVRLAKLQWEHDKRSGLEARKKSKFKSGRVVKRTSAMHSSLQQTISKSTFQKLLGVNVQGIKYRPSPFNSPDLGFHVVSSQPPCLAHDLFEGIVKKILPLILKHFIETKEWFDFDMLNKRIKEFKCKNLDSLDAPTPLKNLDSLSGSSAENWTLLRLLPFIIGDLIEDEEDEMWKLYLQLKELVEYVCAPIITLNQVGYLDNVIKSFIRNIKAHLPSCLIPKLHFLCHYPGLILIFGPLIRLFTLRFESKHMFFKQVARACKNYINITYTLTKKFLCRFAYDHIADILPPDVKFNVSSALPINSSEAEALLGADLNYEDFDEINKVKILGIDYTLGQYLPLKCDDSCDMSFGYIYKILLQKSSNKIFFWIDKRECDASGRGYYVVPKSTSCYELKSIEEFADFYPLSSYEVNNQDCISLKRTNPSMSF